MPLSHTIYASLLLSLRLLYAASIPINQGALDAVLTSGIRPKDTNGKSVHAHGGCILHVNGTYYWYVLGMCGILGIGCVNQHRSLHRTIIITITRYGTTIKHEPGWISSGIALYSSPDLMTWTNHGTVFDGAQINDMPYPPPYRIERPKVL